MNFSRTEEQKTVGQLAAKIFAGLVTRERWKQLDERADPFDEALWKQLGQANLLGVAVADDVGGTDQGLMELCSLLVAAGGAAAPVPLWSASFAAMAIDHFGSAELRRELLPKAMTGESILTLAMAEPNCESPYDPATTAKDVGGAWKLSGVKTCVPAGDKAAHTVVAARTADGGINLYVVSADAAGLTTEVQVGTTRQLLAQLTLEDTPATLLAEGADSLRWLLERATVGLCAMEFGVAQSVLRMTAAYTAERKQFDRPIATFQAVSQRAADAYIDTETIRLSMWEAAWRLSEGRDASSQVALAKYVAADAGQRVTYAAQHLHGGIGFDLDYPLGRFYTYSKQIELSLEGGQASLARLGALLAQA